MTDWKVGDECELNCGEKAEILAVGIEQTSGMLAIKLDDGSTTIVMHSAIKPLKSPEEQKRDEVLESAWEIVESVYGTMSSSQEDKLIESLYDAGMLIHPDDKVSPISEGDFLLIYAGAMSVQGLHRYLLQENHIKPA